MRPETLGTRALAAWSLDRVVRTGAYSNVLLSTTAVGERVDRALYQRLVLDALRYLESVDEAIERAAKRPVARIEPPVLAVLRIGTTEIRHLERAHHSAVSEGVEAVRELGKGRAAGFVNAVLRRVASDASVPVPADATHGTPGWLHGRLEEVFGDEAAAFIEASNAAPPTGIRSRDGVVRGASTGIPGTGYVDHDDTIGAMVGSDLIDVIDPASVAVAESLDVTPGQRVVDLAAAPGGKTRILAERAGREGLVVAADVHPRRLATARERSAGLDNVHWMVADATGPPFREASFDRVLLDAPCTGLGTLRRRPEIRHRLDADAPQRYGELQRRMLAAALRLLAPGGRLVYSVCTVFPEETIDVVAGLGAHVPDLDVGTPWGDGVLLAPHTTATDGMFIAVIDR